MVVLSTQLLSNGYITTNQFNSVNSFIGSSYLMVVCFELLSRDLENRILHLILGADGCISSRDLSRGFNYVVFGCQTLLKKSPTVTFAEALTLEKTMRRSFLVCGFRQQGKIREQKRRTLWWKIKSIEKLELTNHKTHHKFKEAKMSLVVQEQNSFQHILRYVRYSTS